MSRNDHRKCAKCGKTRSEDKTVTYHRFPNPGTANIIKARAWAKYCWPDQDWISDQSLESIYKSNKVLCGRHFSSSQFYDNLRQKLSKFAVPDEKILFELLENKENVLTQSAGPVLQSLSEPATADSTPEVAHSDDSVVDADEATTRFQFSWEKPYDIIPCADESKKGDDSSSVGCYVGRDDIEIKSESHNDKLHLGFKCNECDGEIIGYRYTCVQCCGVELCGACEASGAHPEHYVLRLPRPEPAGRLGGVLDTLRGLLDQEPLVHLSQDRIKMEVDNEDPLHEPTGLSSPEPTKDEPEGQEKEDSYLETQSTDSKETHTDALVANTAEMQHQTNEKVASIVTVSSPVKKIPLPIIRLNKPTRVKTFLVDSSVVKFGARVVPGRTCMGTGAGIPGAGVTLPGSAVRVAAPTVRVSAPTVRVAAPTVRISAPTVRVAAPTVRVAAPIERVAAPTVRIAAPTVSVAAPTVSVAAPIERVAAPTVRVVAPTVSVAAPIERVAAPTVRIAAPTVSVAAPTVSVAAPIERVAAPTVRVVAPTVRIAAPTVSVAAPTVSVAAPIERVAAPTVRVVAPTVSVAAPIERVAAPTVRIAAPTVSVAAPTVSVAAPIERVAAPTVRVVAPTVRIAAPTVSVAAPTVSVAAPIERVAAPTVRVVAPTVSVAAPIERVAAPTVRIAAPTVSVAAPTVSVAAPIERVAAPTMRVVAPTVRIAAPTVSVAAPTVSVAAPIERVAAPTVRVVAPTVSVAAPIERVAAPTLRVVSPTARVAEPIERVAAPTTRVSEASVRLTGADEVSRAGTVVPGTGGMTSIPAPKRKAVANLTGLEASAFEEAKRRKNTLLRKVI